MLDLLPALTREDYMEYQDLEMVAEQLREKSRTSASKYVHPLPELKKEAAEIM